MSKTLTYLNVPGFPAGGGGAVTVSNFPTDYPLPSAQVTTLTPLPDGHGVQEAGYGTTGTVAKQTTTVVGGASQFPSQACKWVRVQAVPSNTDVIYIGDSNVEAAVGSERGLALYTGQYGDFYIQNLDQLYIDVRVDNEGVSVLYLT